MPVWLGPGVPCGSCALDAVARLNMHVEACESREFCPLEAPATGWALAEVELEARLMPEAGVHTTTRDDDNDKEQASPPKPGAAPVRQGRDEGTVVVCDARQVVAAFRRELQGRVLAVGQVAVIQLPGLALRLRVASADTLDATARDEAVTYHCFRGLLAPDTAIFLCASLGESQHAQGRGSAVSGQGSSEGATTTCRRLRLQHCPLRPAACASANRVEVMCSDGETFLVHKQLLRPCIALTRQAPFSLRARRPAPAASARCLVGGMGARLCALGAGAA